MTKIMVIKELKLDDNPLLGVQAISFVKTPAV
jgi:hypothetical protein